MKFLNESENMGLLRIANDSKSVFIIESFV